MKVTKRIVNSKRHTLAYVLGNHKRVTRSEAVKMAQRGHLDGIVAKRGTHSWYITKSPTANVTNLYDLPEVVAR